MYHDIEGDLVRAWQLLNELGEQNAHNHKMSSNLHGITDSLKVCVIRQLATVTQGFTLEVDTSYRIGERLHTQKSQHRCYER